MWSLQLSKLCVLSVGILLAQTSVLFAQTPAPAPAPRPAIQNQHKYQAAQVKPAAAPDKAAAEPTGAELTTASFGDWQLSCRLTPGAAGQPSRRLCEVLQRVVLQGQTAPFAQLGFGKMTPADPLFFTAVVPPNVTFPSSVKLAIDENDKQPVEVAWTRCLPGGCFASLAVNDDVVKRWRAQNEGGRLMFKNGAGQDLVVPISFKGLARALDALAKEN
jgi:invasion protein IalB